MSERDPFDNLGDLIDGPVAPETRFAADLKSQLMSSMAASNRSWEEEQVSVDITYRAFPVAIREREARRRFKPLALVEIAAVAALLIGFAVFIGSGLFSSAPDGPPTIPAAALQDEPEATPADGMEPTVVPPAGLLWQLPLPAGESLDYGGTAVHDGIIYRLLATPSFVGVEAVDGEVGAVLWKKTADWSGFGVTADEAGIYFIAGPDQSGSGRIQALATATGDDLWLTPLPGYPNGLTLNDGTLFVSDDTGDVTALDGDDGSILWQVLHEDIESRELASGEERMIDSVPPVVEGDTVVALLPDGTIRALSRETGEPRWEQEEFDALSTRMIGTNDVLVVVTAASSHGYAATPTAGIESTVEDDAIRGGSDVSGENTGVEAIDSGQVAAHLVVGFDLADGSRLWRQYVTGPLSQPAAAGMTVVISGMPTGMTDDEPPQITPNQPAGNTVLGIDVATGAVSWTAPPNVDMYSWVTTWNVEDERAAGFVAVTESGRITPIGPWVQDRGQAVSINLGQPLRDVPRGDDFGLAATLLDGTLVGIQVDRSD